MKKKLLCKTFLLTIFIILICILLLTNCSKNKSVEKNSKSKHQHLEMLGNLLQMHISITSPEFQPSLPDPIIILKQFEPIPPDRPELAEKIIEFLPAVNYWRIGRSDEVINIINNMKNKDDIAYRFLMDAYVKLDSNNKAIEFGDKIRHKDNQIIMALGICALRAHQFDKAISFFSQLNADTTWGELATEQIGNAYFSKAYSSMSDSTQSLRNSFIKEAIAHWEKVQSSRNLFPRIKYALGVANYLLEDYDKARNYSLEIYEERETYLLARLFTLLSLNRQKKEKELALEVNKIYIESEKQTEEARDLLKTVILSYYFLGEDQYEIGNYAKARDYWLKARNALYAYDFPGTEKLDFLYIRAIIYQMIKETSEKQDSVKKGYQESTAPLFTFQELYDSLHTQVEWKPQYNQYAEKIGDVLFMLNENELSYKFFKLTRNPNIITLSNLIAINPKEAHSFSIADLMKFDQEPYAFFIVLSIFSSILLNQANYSDVPQLLDKLINLRDFVKASNIKESNVLLLRFCDSLRVAANRYYNKWITELEAKKSTLYIKGNDLTFIDHELDKVNDERKTLIDKILQVQSKIPEMTKEDLIISKYIFIPMDSSNANIDDIIIFPEMNLSQELYSEKKEK